jgi:hypothetical protein
MGTYRYSGRKVGAWAKTLGEKPKSAPTWLTVFKDHPEFFRADVDAGGFQTLALRRAQPRVFNTKTKEEITLEEFRKIPKDQRRHFSRRPLSTEQILSLVDVAVRLQTQAVMRKQELRWLVVVFFGLLSSFVGAFVGAIIKAS